MQTLKQLERLQRLHELIAAEKTGTPCHLAQLFGVSKRSLFMLIEQLRDMKAKVSFCRTRNTYYYKDNFELQVSVSVQTITADNAVNVFGGSYFKSESQLQTSLSA